MLAKFLNTNNKRKAIWGFIEVACVFLIFLGAGVVLGLHDPGMPKITAFCLAVLGIVIICIASFIRREHP